MFDQTNHTRLKKPNETKTCKPIFSLFRFSETYYITTFFLKNFLWLFLKSKSFRWKITHTYYVHSTVRGVSESSVFQKHFATKLIGLRTILPWKIQLVDSFWFSSFISTGWNMLVYLPVTDKLTDEDDLPQKLVSYSETLLQRRRKPALQGAELMHIPIV